VTGSGSGDGRRRIAKLDGRQRSKSAVLARLGRGLGLPAPIRNLDALYDVLRRDVRGPFTVAWRPGTAARAALGDDYGRLRAVLEQVAAERDDVRLELDG
jgi:RNAse (barnase) inhibitor barstar